MKEGHDFAHGLVRERLRDLLKELGCEEDLLDVGCGIFPIGGVGLDIDPKYGDIQGDARCLPFRDESFQFVVCSAVLHHIKDYNIEELKRVVKKGGYLVIMEPNIFNISGLLMNIFNRLFPGITGLDPIERALSPLKLVKSLDRCIAASFVWNRFPLFLSKFIAKHEGCLRFRRPFCYMGWFSIIYGKKV